MQTKGFNVTEAGVKSSAATHIVDYNIAVVGGPVYAGALIKDKMNDLSITQGTKVGVFGSGQGATSSDDITLI